MRVVIDASIAIKWYIPEIYEQQATWLLAGSYDLNAPELIIPEFGNIVWKKERRGEFSSQSGQEIVKAFQSTDLILYPHGNTASAAFVGAELTGQTVYDWTYLSLALSLSCQFVTADEKFYKTLERTSLKDNLLWVGDIV